MNWKYRALHLTLTMLLVGAHSTHAQNYVLPVTMLPPAVQKQPIAPASSVGVYKPVPVTPVIEQVVALPTPAPAPKNG